MESECWACRSVVTLDASGNYRCSCGATGTVSAPKKSPAVKGRVCDVPGGLVLSLAPELKERLESAAKKQGLAPEAYAVKLLIREVGRTHKKGQVR